MVSKMNLKGNKLLAYALIYGFSQDGQSVFKGSISYVTRWLNCARSTAIETLEQLEADGWIEKTKKATNGIDRNEYKAANVDQNGVVRFSDGGSTETGRGVVRKPDGGSTETGHKKPISNPFGNQEESSNVVFIENDPAYLVTTVAIERPDETSADLTAPAAAPKSDKKKAVQETAEQVREIVSHLNAATGSEFRPNTKATVQAINARLEEGYTVADFKEVIDVKAAQWKGDDKMQGYLRGTFIKD